MSAVHPVRRVEADRQWLLLIAAFGASVVGTRLFLQATGYPQIGGATLHIAHLLWGGLFLFIAIAIQLTLANHWAYNASAIIGGLGIGLFIDEVGKFITRTNDYFYPLAAPIIYGFFLITVLAYLYLRQRRPNQSRPQLYWALDELKDIVDQDYTEEEREAVQRVLQEVIATSDNATHRQIAQSLMIVSTNASVIAPPEPNLLQRLARRLHSLEERRVGRRLFRLGLIVAYLFSSLTGMLLTLLLVGLAGSEEFRTDLQQALLEQAFVTRSANLGWIVAMISLYIMVGVLYIGAALLLLMRRDGLGTLVGRLALIIDLMVVNLLAYYFNQFAMISSTLLALVVLLATEHFRTRFLVESQPFSEMTPTEVTPTEMV